MAKKNVLADMSKMSAEDQAELALMLDTWHKSQANLTLAADAEMKARMALVEKYFGSAVEGTNRITLLHGKSLVAKMTVYRRVDAAAYDTMRKVDDTYLQGVLDRLVKMKPEVSVSFWKELPQEWRNFFADMVTESPGKPALAIDEPKR